MAVFCRAIVTVLVLAQRVTVVLVAVAIVLGMLFHATESTGSGSDPARPQGFGLREEGNLTHLYLRPSDGAGVLHTVLHDPSGKEMMIASYHRISGLSCLLAGQGALRTCLWTGPQGTVSFCARVGQVNAVFEVRSDGEGGLEVRESCGTRSTLRTIRDPRAGAPPSTAVAD